jgi:6-phospho-3-hexuloisomerase
MDGDVAVSERADASGVRTVCEEVVAVLSAVSPEQVRNAADLLADRTRRWFFCGQGRSGLVARMVAMRLMHVGFEAHVVGEATAPSIAAGDGLMAFSGSGETPVTLHFAGLAHQLGARILAVTTRADSALAGLAQARIDLPASASQQFGGTLFEQGALLVLDALALNLTATDPAAHAQMQARHANLQ